MATQMKGIEAVKFADLMDESDLLGELEVLELEDFFKPEELVDSQDQPNN